MILWWMKREWLTKIKYSCYKWDKSTNDIVMNEEGMPLTKIKYSCYKWDKSTNDIVMNEEGMLLTKIKYSC